MYKQLQGHGFHVWLDDRDIKGNIYDAMAAAVNNAFLILMFVSSNYEMSGNCQSEACFAKSASFTTKIKVKTSLDDTSGV